MEQRERLQRMTRAFTQRTCVSSGRRLRRHCSLRAQPRVIVGVEAICCNRSLMARLEGLRFLLWER